ncbi:MAG: hypothetical protein ACK6EB_45290, partial [Planctomyces sp.]
VRFTSFLSNAQSANLCKVDRLKHMIPQTSIFDCSSTTCLDCVDKQVFGSNKPWPLEIWVGDYCLLHHSEIGGLLELWQATSTGRKNLVLDNQSRTLATVRNTLLQKLLSGEFSASFVERLDPGGN